MMEDMHLRKQMIWLLFACMSSMVLVTVLLPGAIVKSFSGAGSLETPDVQSVIHALDGLQPLNILVPVYLSQEGRIASIPLERYVRGVLAAEMPANFELEALKAQAIAARTYVIRRMKELELTADTSLPAAAWLSDTITHQAYADEKQLLEKWGVTDYVRNIDKLTQAVLQTQGQIITYSNEPIDATFFSTSSGFTENSEDYWGNFVPYLRSVDSPWDELLSPRYTETIRMSLSHFSAQLELQSSVLLAGGNDSIRILERSAGNHIKRIAIGDKLFTGRQIRESLGLNSSYFQWIIMDNRIEITTFGNGHGVGMSQWGANGMAKSGYTAEQIVRHYYQDVNIEPLEQVLNRYSEGSAMK
jgi:stage II sporulation protein D